MARIIVFGGHGKVALLLTRMLADRGDTVTSVVRNPDHGDEVSAAGGTPEVADIESQTIDSLTELIRGHDAVVWSAGAGGGSAERTVAVDQDAAVFSMQAALAAGVRRYVMVSWSGSVIEHGVPQSEPFFAYAQAKYIADAVLRDSGLDWTIVAPSTLTLDEPTGRVSEAPESTSVSRADVAALVVATLDSPAAVGTTYRFNSGDTPIADFVG